MASVDTRGAYPPDMSSSSSESEDWSAFHSVAVTAEDVAAVAKKEREYTKVCRGGKQHRSRQCSEGGSNEGAGAAQDDGELDHFQLKVAAALEQLVESQLKWVAPSKELTAAAAGEGDQPTETDARFKFFRKVKHGAPCVVDKPEEEAAAKPVPVRQAYGPKYPRLSPDDLQSVVVEGLKIMELAFPALMNTRQVKLPAEGTVMEGRPHVPHEQRIAKLLGLQTEYVRE